MYSIEALHPEGWQEHATAKLEYWACQEAQIRCCSDGRHYRIRHRESDRIVALVDPSSCRAVQLGSTLVPASVDRIAAIADRAGP